MKAYEGRQKNLTSSKHSSFRGSFCLTTLFLSM